MGKKITKQTRATAIVHLCNYDVITMEGDAPEDSTWAVFIDKYGRCEPCRFKWDGVDHFFPHSEIIDIEDVVAWIGLEDIRELVRSKGVNVGRGVKEDANKMGDN